MVQAEMDATGCVCCGGRNGCGRVACKFRRQVNHPQLFGWSGQRPGCQERAAGVGPTDSGWFDDGTIGKGSPQVSVSARKCRQVPLTSVSTKTTGLWFVELAEFSSSTLGTTGVPQEGPTTIT